MKALAWTGSALPIRVLPSPDPVVQPILASNFEPTLVSSILFSGADTTGLGRRSVFFLCFLTGGGGG